MPEYYEAYDARYRAIHGTGARWFSDAPSPIVGQTLAKYGFSPGAHMLELGCGEGRDAIPLMRAGFDLLATDVSPAAIACCRQLCPQYAGRFAVLDCLRGETRSRFDFIYAVAVVHMLVPDDDRLAFYRFLRTHLTQRGLALVCSMGDGEMTSSSDPREAFELREREFKGKTLLLPSTSCRMVDWPAFEAEIGSSGLSILEKGLTAVEPDFPEMMYAVVTIPDCSAMS